MALFRDVYALYRIGHRTIENRIPLVPKMLNIIKRLLYPACDIPFTAEIGEGTFFPHRAIGVVIHANAVIGKNAKIESNVVIGGRNGKGAPHIGDNVFIGTGASILGDITVGDDCMIGSGAVVIKDVPPASIVGGVPAKVIRKVPSELIGKHKD